MKNILFVYHVSTIGGGSLCLLNIIKELDRQRFKPFVLLREKGKLAEELSELGVDVYYDKRIRAVPYNRSLLSIRLIINLILMTNSLIRFKRWLNKCDADIVYLNTMMLYPYLLPSGSRRKTVIHIREQWPKGEHKVQFNFARKCIDKYASKIIAINETSKHMINLPQKTEVVYDWIDFSGREGEINFKNIFGKDYKSYTIFLYLGGMQRIKGALEIVTSFSKLKDYNRARLLFVGYENNRVTRKNIKHVALRLLNFFGYESYSQKVMNYIKSDARIKTIPSTKNVKDLILKSDINVSFPIIPHAILPIAESIFLNRKILTAKTSEALEYAGNEKNGLFVEIRNEGELTEKMKRVMVSGVDNKLVDRLSIVKKFDKKINSEKLNSLIWSM